MTATPRDTTLSAEVEHAFPLATLEAQSEVPPMPTTSESQQSTVDDLAQRLMAFADELTKASPLAIQRLKIELPTGEAVALVFPLDRWQLSREGYLKYTGE